MDLTATSDVIDKASVKAKTKGISPGGNSGNSGNSSQLQLRPQIRHKSCFNCAHRKRRCDRAQPACTACRTSRLQCEYRPKPDLVLCISTPHATRKPTRQDDYKSAMTTRPLTNLHSPMSWRVQLHSHSAVAFFPEGQSLPPWCSLTTMVAASDTATQAALDASCLLQVGLKGSDQRLSGQGRILYGNSLRLLRQRITHLSRGGERNGAAQVQAILCAIHCILICEALGVGTLPAQNIFAHCRSFAALSDYARSRSYQLDPHLDHTNFCAFRVWASLCEGVSTEGAEDTQQIAFLDSPISLGDEVEPSPSLPEDQSSTTSESPSPFLLAVQTHCQDVIDSVKHVENMNDIKTDAFLQSLTSCDLECVVQLSVYIGYSFKSEQKRCQTHKMEPSPRMQHLGRMLVEITRTLLHSRYGCLGVTYAMGPLRLLCIERSQRLSGIDISLEAITELQELSRERLPTVLWA